MTNADQNPSVRKAADSAVEYESAFEAYIRNKPLTAIAISAVVGAVLAKFLF